MPLTNKSHNILDTDRQSNIIHNDQPIIFKNKIFNSLSCRTIMNIKWSINMLIVSLILINMYLFFCFLRCDFNNTMGYTPTETQTNKLQCEIVIKGKLLVVCTLVDEECRHVTVAINSGAGRGSRTAWHCSTSLKYYLPTASAAVRHLQSLYYLYLQTLSTCMFSLPGDRFFLPADFLPALPLAEGFLYLQALSTFKFALPTSFMQAFSTPTDSTYRLFLQVCRPFLLADFLPVGPLLARVLPVGPPYLQTFYL